MYFVDCLKRDNAMFEMLLEWLKAGTNNEDECRWLRRRLARNRAIIERFSRAA
jgi:hypothetical protein